MPRTYSVIICAFLQVISVIILQYIAQIKPACFAWSGLRQSRCQPPGSRTFRLRGKTAGRSRNDKDIRSSMALAKTIDALSAC